LTRPLMGDPLFSFGLFYGLERQFFIHCRGRLFGRWIRRSQRNRIWHTHVDQGNPGALNVLNLNDCRSDYLHGSNLGIGQRQYLGAGLLYRCHVST